MSKQIPVRILVLLVIVFSLLSGCKAASPKAVTQNKAAIPFNILTLTSINNSGLLRQLTPAFEQANHCKVSITGCANSAELMELVRNDKEIRRFDLVIGLDNCFLNGAEDYSLFASTELPKKIKIRSECQIEKSGRIIPYGYGYLALLYNKAKINPPPETFGELQDAAFQNQMVVCNPHTSAVGRATLLWTVALFGETGYQQFWKSIKKNIFTVSETSQDALNLLQNQTCSMTFGLSGTPAWITQTQTNPAPVALSMLQEGSFLYVEAAAIPKKAKQKALAEAFLSSLLTPEHQTQMTSCLGLLPVNDSAPLPTLFAGTPYYAVSVNNQLSQTTIEHNLNNWLAFWDRLFSHTLY